MTAGYSGTPLVKKLGIKQANVLVLLNAPDDFDDLIAPLPPQVKIRRNARGKADIVVCFIKSRVELEQRLDSLGRMIYPDAMMWVCWPKKASKVPTDVTEDVVRAVALPRGLVDVKVCAIDATWSGLKLVWRRERR